LSEPTSPYSRRSPAKGRAKGATTGVRPRTGSHPAVAAVGAGPEDTIRNPSTRVPLHRSDPVSLTTASGQPAPRSRWRGYLLIVLAALAVVVGRVAHDSWSALRAGDAVLARGDATAATREYLHAVRMYLPRSPFVARALDRLDQVARKAAAAGDLTSERQAWESVRAGLLGARSLYTPYPDRLAAANGRLAILYAQIEEERVAPGASAAERQRWHADRLAPQPGPAVPATVAALLGLGLWLGAVVVFIRRGVDRGLRLDRRWSGYCAVAFLAGFSLFVLGLRLA
jgi:hypothetical protein